jgi:hypothetical protein
MFNDKRKNPRFVSYARARVPELFDGEVPLKNISVTGCGIESTMHINAKPGDRFRMEIICEPASNIGNFKLQVESRWVRMNDYSFEAGFSIVESPKGKQFQRYVDYLAFCSQSK